MNYKIFVASFIGYNIGALFYRFADDCYRVRQIRKLRPYENIYD